MLERTEVKEGCEYMLDGKRVIVLMIHKRGKGESITLYDAPPTAGENPYPYLRKGTIQMRLFQRAALKVSSA